MASVSNPVLAMQDSNWSSLLPGRNPTGSTGAGTSSVPSTGSSSGQNPALPPTNLPAGAPASNPYAPGSAVPTFGANSGGYSPTSLVPGGTGLLPSGGTGSGTGTGVGAGTGISNMNPAQLSNLQKNLISTYGKGMGAALFQFLQGGAGFNQDAINNLFASLQPGIERGTESLMEQFSTSGNRFGSGAQIGEADYLSQVQLNEGQLETQMYEQSIQNYISTLMGTGSANASRMANSPSFMDTLSGLLPMISGGAGAASAAGVGGTAGSILDVIAGLA
jgi:hypothetical protein